MHAVGVNIGKFGPKSTWFLSGPRMNATSYTERAVHVIATKHGVRDMRISRRTHTQETGLTLQVVIPSAVAEVCLKM